MWGMSRQYNDQLKLKSVTCYEDVKHGYQIEYFPFGEMFAVFVEGGVVEGITSVNRPRSARTCAAAAAPRPPAWSRSPWPIRPLLKLRMISTEEGARTTLYCATEPRLAGESGLYYDKCQPRTPSAMGRDTALAAELWQRSMQWIEARDT